MSMNDPRNRGPRRGPRRGPGMNSGQGGMRMPHSSLPQDVEVLSEADLAAEGLLTFAALANCGFPEAHHNRTALEICAQFAAAAGMTWAGGLALGAGGAVHGQPLSATLAHPPVKRPATTNMATQSN